MVCSFVVGLGCSPAATTPGGARQEQGPSAEKLAAIEAYENYRADYFAATVQGLAGQQKEATERWGGVGDDGFAEVAAIELDDGSVAYTTIGFGAPVMGNQLGFEFVAFADSVDRRVGDTLLAIGFSAGKSSAPIAPYHRFAFSGDEPGPNRFFFLDGGSGPDGYSVHRIVVAPVPLEIYEQYAVGVEETETPQAVRLLGLGDGRPVLRSLPPALRAMWGGNEAL